MSRVQRASTPARHGGKEPSERAGADRERDLRADEVARSFIGLQLVNRSSRPVRRARATIAISIRSLGLVRRGLPAAQLRV